MMILGSMRLAAALLAGAPQQPVFELNELQSMTRISSPPPMSSPDRPSGPMIAGLGELIFAPDPIDFPLDIHADFKRSNEFGLYGTLELGIRRDGSIATCIDQGYASGSSEKSNNKQSAYICNVIKKKARFQFADGVVLPDVTSYVVISYTWAKQFTPKAPIQFGRKDSGLSAYFYMEPKAKVPSEQCRLYADEVTDEASVKICEALLASPAFRNRSAQFMRKRSSKGTYTVAAWVLPDKGAKEQSLVKWSETNYDQNPPAFVDAAAYPKNGLDKAETGQFFWTLKYSDRPDANLESWRQHQGSAVLNVTINPDGSVQGCRPYQYSDAAVMDFRACEIAKKTGRFVITNGVKADEPYDVLVDVEWPRQ